MKNLVVRTCSGIVLVAVFVGAVLWSPWSFGLLLLLILIGGQRELYRLAREEGISPQVLLGQVGGLSLFIANFCFATLLNGASNDFYQIAISLSISLILSIFIFFLLPTLLFVCEIFRRSATPVANIGTTLLGVVYVALPLSLMLYLPLLTTDAWRPEVVLGYVFVVWANDVFAYLVGANLGRHHLCERLSPKKSWEGFFGGLIGALVMGLLVARLLHDSYLLWLGLALVTGLSAVAGDLVESMFKRASQVKDSGTMIPGHGGVLDRFDAMLLSAPCVFIYLLICKIYEL